ncbi:MAG: DegV family protein [Clostridiales bacterium]|nr:DegV family protein [Clostridiales bacterium]
MRKYVILPDVTCDLNEEIRSYFGIEDYIPGYVNINGKEYVTTLDWKHISREEFYKTLDDKKSTVSSAAPSPEQYYQKFKEYAEKGYAVISMSLSSKISATYNVAFLAAKRVKEEMPNAAIYCVDTTRMSGSFGLLVMYAYSLQKQGKTYEEVINWLEENKVKVHQMGPIDGLTFIARRGRISAGKAIMGNLIGIKPMGDSNTDGYVTVLAKAKGIKKALAATLAYVKAMAVDIENQYVLISHSDREEIAKAFKEKFESEIKCKKVFFSDIFSACGTNMGPGVICVYFMGNPISEECAVEKEALVKALAEC